MANSKKYLDLNLTKYFGQQLLTNIKNRFVLQETGKGLSTEDYTTAEKTRLAGIAEGAQVNVLEGIVIGTTDATIDLNKKVTLGTLAGKSAVAETDLAQALADKINSAADGTAVQTLIGSDTNKSVRTIANEELAAQLIPENAQESLNTLQEISAWIQSHPSEVADINAKLTLGTHEVEGEQKQYDSVKDYVEAYVGSQITNLGIDDYVQYTDLANESEIDTAITEIFGTVFPAVQEPSTEPSGD